MRRSPDCLDYEDISLVVEDDKAGDRLLYDKRQSYSCAAPDNDLD